MPDLARLEAQVIARPLENAPRLAYADAVEPTDFDRSRFVYLQVEACRLRRENVGHITRSMNLADEADALLARHDQHWRPRFGTVTPDVQWSRGFVETVIMNAGDFLVHGDTLFERAPVLHAVLREAKPVFADLAASPLLGRLRALSLVNNALDDADAIAIAQSPHVERLVWLDLSTNRIARAGLDAIAASSSLAALQWLGFAHNEAPDPTAGFGQDYSGIVHTGFQPPHGELVAKYGERPWLAPPKSETSIPTPDLFYPIVEPRY